MKRGENLIQKMSGQKRQDILNRWLTSDAAGKWDNKTKQKKTLWHIKAGECFVDLYLLDRTTKKWLHFGVTHHLQSEIIFTQTYLYSKTPLTLVQVFQSEDHIIRPKLTLVFYGRIWQTAFSGRKVLFSIYLLSLFQHSNTPAELLGDSNSILAQFHPQHSEWNG